MGRYDVKQSKGKGEASQVSVASGCKLFTCKSTCSLTCKITTSGRPAMATNVVK